MRLRPRLFCSLLLAILVAALACNGDNLSPPATGTLQVTTTTSGAEPDVDGYMVQVDAQPAIGIGATATLETADLVSGAHTVLLSGIAPNCVVAGENPRPVTVIAGETTSVTYSVTCEAATGNLQVNVITSGDSPDPNGYSVLLDGGPVGHVGVNGVIMRGSLAPGTHTLGLSDVAGHCRVEGDNPRVIEIPLGDRASVSFTVTCPVPPMIAFVSNAGISLVNPDGSGLRRLTDGTTPAWSPDRSRIAFFGDGISVINADGTGRASLTQGLKLDLTYDRVQWSPDGTTIAFQVDPGPIRDCCPYDIWLIDSDGANARKLVTDGRSPSWSPDGRKIAFHSSRDGNNELYVIAADGSGLSRLTNRPDYYDTNPVWSPDGSRLVFGTAILGTRYDVGVINADGTGLMNLTQGLESSGNSVWLPDGRIAFQTGYSWLAVMNPDGTDQIILNHVDRMTTWVSWSPNGRQVAFTRHGPVTPGLGGPELNVMNADGTSLKNLSNDPAAFDIDPDW